MKIDTELLNTFLKVAATESVSRAAAALHLTQPAVSKRIAGLEQALQTPLFDRIGHRLLLTEAGRILMPRAREIVEQINDTRVLLRNLEQKVGGRLTIGTSHHIGLHRLPPLLRRYTRRYPEVSLDIRFLGSEQGCIGVEAGELELAIVTLPLETPKPLQTRTLWQDPLVFVVGREHALAGRDRVRFSELNRYKAILPEPGTYTRSILERALQPQTIGPQSSMSTNYLETIKMLVSVGLGWSLLPRSMCSEDLHRLKVPGLKLSRRLGIVTHRSRTLSNAARALIDMLQ